MCLVKGRTFAPCRTSDEIPTDDLIAKCNRRGCFVLHCPQYPGPTHRTRLVFTDGACRNNGRVGAQAGIGVASGIHGDDQLSIPITDNEDRAKRTNQRAELLAAIQGLKLLHAKIKAGSQKDGFKNKIWVVVTDSKYVVDGMTDWLPNWKSNGYRNNEGKTPTNLDLFLELDAKTKKYEQKGYHVAFWHVLRHYNRTADALAQQAARRGTPHFERAGLANGTDSDIQEITAYAVSAWVI